MQRNADNGYYILFFRTKNISMMTKVMELIFNIEKENMSLKKL